jgi:periplasmic protein TonB
MTEAYSSSNMQEDHSKSIFLLLAILVLILHVFGIAWINQPQLTDKIKSQPFKLEVAMISVPAPKTSPHASSKPKASPTLQKPSENQEKISNTNSHEPTPPPQAIDRLKIKNNTQKFSTHEKSAKQSQTLPQIVKSQSVLNTKQTVSSAMIENSHRQTHAKDNFIADELHNPSPEYPEMAVFLGYQGNAFVQIHVSAQGVSEQVKVVKSSGHKILDESAANALKKWRFIPSRQDNKAVADTIIISVVFTLH